MPAPPPPSSSTIVRFFKIITKPSVEDGKLRIPNGFTRKYGDNMSNPFSLKTSDGKEWSIHWTKNDEDIWFQKGWKEFATHYSLDHGHMVLFEYDKNTNQFEVHIFDESSLEIEYNFHGSQSEQNNFNQISDDSGESLDEIPQCKKTRPKSPMPCPQPHKKPRTNTSENVVTSFKVHNLSAVDMWNMIPQSLKTRPKSPLSTPQPHKKSKTDKSEDGGRVKECLKSEKGLESLTSKIAEALHTAFTANYPTFTVIMLSTFVNQHLNVPSKFAKMYFERKQSNILLQVLDERTWPVEYHLGRIDVGWKTFASENSLKVGDVCIFELTKREPLTLKVLIFRCGEKTHFPPPQESVQGDEVNLLDPEKLLEVKNEPIISEEVNRETRRNSLEDRDSPLSNTNEALNEAKKFTSENPFFRITVTAKLPNYTVNVPKHFSSKYFGKTQTVMLKVQEKTWPVKLLCYPYQAPSSFSAGWSLFVQECKLQTGDVCVFELINKENVVLDVHIFRSKPIMTNKESVQGDEVNFLDPEKLLEVENEPIISEEVNRETRRNSLGDRDSPLSNTNEALNEAKKFTSENPFFRITVAAKLPIYTVNVPKHFSSKYFEKTQTVMLKVQEKTWPVKLLCYPYQASSRFTAGWSLFVQECKLQTGDVCVFELINKENVVLDVHIFRSKSIMTNKESVQGDEVNFLDPEKSLEVENEPISSEEVKRETRRNSLGDRDSPLPNTNEALNEAKKFTSENPFFRITVAELPIYTVNVPKHFSSKYFEKTQTVMLKVQEKTWPVKLLCHPYQASSRVSAGWSLFVQECKLQTGDVCVFELINKENVVLDVHIFRSKSIMTNKESVQGDEVNFLDPEKSLEVENEPISSEEVKRETRRNSLGDRDSPLSNTNEALNEAKKFTSENPFFRITVAARLQIYTVNVPKHFSSKYFEKTQTVMLKVQEKTWPVKLLCYPYQASSSFSAGWSLFVQECKLQTGDVCVFELVNKENVVLDVHIFRSKSIRTNKDGKETRRASLRARRDSLTNGALKETKKITSDATDGKETPTTPLQTSCDSFTNEALKEAKKFTSENPLFIVNIKPIPTWRKFVPKVPSAFTRDYMNSKTQTVKLQFDKKSWPVNCLCYSYKQQMGSLGSGWNVFAEENKVQAGDVCVFELIKKEDAVFDVHIFRGHS